MERHVIGEQIKRMRGRFRISQAVLANKLDVSKQSVSSWERGIKMPRMSMLQRIADVFNIDISDLTSDITKTKEEKQNTSNYGSVDSFTDRKPSIHGIINVCLNLTPSRILDVYSYALTQLRKQNDQNNKK